AGPEAPQLDAEGRREARHRGRQPVLDGVLQEGEVQRRDRLQEVGEVALERPVGVRGVRPRRGQVGRQAGAAGRGRLVPGARLVPAVGLLHGGLPDASAGAAKVVTGRHCSSTGPSSARANSTSTGWPRRAARPVAMPATASASSSLRLARWRRKVGVLTCRVPASSVMVIRCFAPTVLAITLRLALSTTQRSGSMSPAIRLSPRPQLALITTRPRSEATGSTLNATPEASQLTSRCTSTATAAGASPRPRSRRYPSAASPRAERHTPATAASTASSPVTFR